MSVPDFNLPLLEKLSLEMNKIRKMPQFTHLREACSIGLWDNPCKPSFPWDSPGEAPLSVTDMSRLCLALAEVSRYDKK